MNLKGFLKPTKAKGIMFASLLFFGVLSGISFLLIPLQFLGRGVFGPAMCLDAVPALLGAAASFVGAYFFLVLSIPLIAVAYGNGLLNLALGQHFYAGSGFVVFIAGLALFAVFSYFLACLFAVLDAKIKPKIKVNSIVVFFILIFMAGLLSNATFCMELPPRDSPYITDQYYCEQDSDCVVNGNRCGVVNKYHYTASQFVCAAEISNPHCENNRCVSGLVFTEAMSTLQQVDTS